MLTEHPELKTICDEHEDDLEDTVEFYRKVGGVQYVLPHPNCAPDEMLRCEWKLPYYIHVALSTRELYKRDETSKYCRYSYKV